MDNFILVRMKKEIGRACICAYARKRERKRERKDK